MPGFFGLGHAGIGIFVLFYKRRKSDDKYRRILMERILVFRYVFFKFEVCCFNAVYTVSG